MEPFFLLDGKVSEEYLFVRERRNYPCASAHDLIKEMWPLCSAFLDSDLRQDARMNFHQRWWEVYLTCSLLRSSVELISRDCRQPKQNGPDLLVRIAGSNLWIEAVAPGPGQGPDAVLSSRSSKGPKPFPDKEMMLRFQQAFSTKASAHAKYVEKGWVGPNEGYVVALNGARAEVGYPCTQRFPRIVNFLLRGLETEKVLVEFDEVRTRAMQHFYSYQSRIEKKKTKEPVDLAPFSDPANSCVSAVLYSRSDAFNCLCVPGVEASGYEVMSKEFVLVLNPLAQVPLPPGFLSAIPRF